MTTIRSRALLVLVGLVIVAGVPLAGKWARRRSDPCCDFDGLRIEPLYRVRVVDRSGGSHDFCCVRCADLWLARHGEEPAAVYVMDEADGGEIDARSATFVRSTAVTNPITGNRVHAFRDRTAAEEHVAAFGGEVLTGAERPFRVEVQPHP
jgi:hypothetical protein